MLARSARTWDFLGVFLIPVMHTDLGIDQFAA
jgi:hypothetical protein